MLTTRVRRFLSDTLVMALLVIPGPALVEWYLFNLRVEQVISARAVSVLAALMTSGLYGRFADRCVAFFVEQRIGHGNSAWCFGHWSAFLCFQAPLYAATLGFIGMSLLDATTGFVSCAALAVVLGPMTGLCLDAARHGTERGAHHARTTMDRIRPPTDGTQPIRPNMDEAA